VDRWRLDFTTEMTEKRKSGRRLTRIKMVLSSHPRKSAGIRGSSFLSWSFSVISVFSVVKSNTARSTLPDGRVS
jgi:hypothetical protein